MATGSSDAASEVQGRLTSDGCTGRSVVSHGWGEEIIYMTPLPAGAAGGGCTTLVNPNGWYAIRGNFPAGDYLMSTFAIDRAPAFAVSRVTLPGGSGIVEGVELRTPAHYSVAYNQHFDEWGPSPWIWGSDMYQTFKATSPNITRLVTKLAGKSGDHYWLRLNFAIYRPNDGPPSTWQLVSPIRSYYFGGGVDPIIVYGWVPYRSNEVNLIVGQTYALRLWVAPGSQSTSFAVVARPDKGNGYADGHLYVDGVARPDLDAYAYISGGEPGTVTNHIPISKLEFTSMAGWATRFGQTFTATGSSLAGACIVYTTGQPDTPSLPIEFRLYDRPGGTQIGPTRKINGVHGFFQGRASVAWVRGEAPLVPGQQYYLEWTPPASGCATWFTEEALPGTGYVNGVAQSQDLMMAIAEYKPEAPEIVLSTSRIELSVLQNSAPVTRTFTVTNVGAGTLSYQITDDRDWMSVSPEDGTSTTEADTITVTFTPTGLPIGTYTGVITVADPQAINSPQNVTVEMIVRKYPGDMDGDIDVDQEDWGWFQRCLTGAGIAQTALDCADARLDFDDDVDDQDASIFVSCMGGPDRPIPAGCPTGE